MERFTRIKKIIDEETFLLLSNIKVLIVGIGGVGGIALENLVRSGIKNITIIDNDSIEISNINRQIFANNETLGCQKVKIAKERMQKINPQIQIEEINEFLTPNNFDLYLKNDYDYIIDACDTITVKVELIKYAHKKNIKIISSMGTGNRFDPTKLEITDLQKTINDPVAKILRKLLKNENIKKIPVVSSKELPIKTGERTPGSISFVPCTAGIFCAYYIIDDFLKNHFSK